MHVDGGGEPSLVRAILRDRERAGGKGKLDVITGSIAGPQRDDFPQTYESHTPGVGESERFEYFSTIQLKDRVEAIDTLRQTLPITTATAGIVVEVEHVVGRIDARDKWSAIDIDRIRPIETSEVGFDRAATLAYELHIAIDIRQQAPPFTLNELLESSIDNGVRVGSWFEFRKDQVWAYRSNAFAGEVEFAETARASHESMERWLNCSGFDYCVWTIAERVIGVWRHAS
jgi:hypothetical protein